MGKWKYDITKIMIDNHVDPKVWFQVMIHTADVHNHHANKMNDDNCTPLPSGKGKSGDIMLLTDFYFYE